MKKKLLAVMMAGCLAAGMTVWGAGIHNGTVYAQAVAELDAKQYVETLLTGDAADLESYAYTQELLTALQAGGGFAGLQASMKQLGEVKSVEEPVVSEAAGYISYSVPCQMELQNLNIMLNVDAEGKIAGIVTMPYTGDMEEAVLPEGVTELELSIPVEGGEGWELPGTLTMPEGDGPFPTVVLVHGSGPNDRDETISVNKPFRDIAWGLAQQGIAVYRYDKRTNVYGAEMAADSELTLHEETVEDAATAVSVLKEQDKIDAEQVYVLGHSLGGLALPRIRETLADGGEEAAGYVFLAAPARGLAGIMREQYDFLYSLMPELDEEQQTQKEQAYAELDRLEDLDAVGDDETVMGAYKKYWQDLEDYDQVALAAGITERCLVLQGEEDYQVTMEDFGIWKEAYGEADNWEFISYPGLTHLLMTGEKANGSADYAAPQNVDAKVITDIAEFVKGE